MASGVQIEGLQQPSGSGSSAAKKVVYGNRKKKGPVAKDVSPAPESRPRSPEPVASPSPALAEKPVEAIPANGDAKSNEDAKSDWEASDEDDVKAQEEAVKDSWDASSDDEEEKPRKFDALDSNSFLIYTQQNLLNP